MSKREPKTASNSGARVKEEAAKKATGREARGKASSKSAGKSLAKPLGILGGGQLARMMALEAHRLGLPVAIYSASKSDPAAQVVSDWHQGSVDDARALKSFLSHCSVATFESEFMDAELLARLSATTGTRISPSPALMGAIQDRLTQKMMLERHGLPTAPFHNVKDAAAAKVSYEVLGGKVVFKKRRFGYDGYGTFVVRNVRELAAFLPLVEKEPHGFICERFVPFKREVAVIACRSADGSTIRFPFVETYQENSRCLWVKGPLKPSSRLASIGRAVDRFLAEIGYIGTIGIELFETADGYVVNELAPRVHNSGHYTQDAMSLDQFSAHVSAVIGAELEAPVARAGGFAMMNLLGGSDRTPSWSVPPDVHFHWYGKSENRAGRKMGHYNVLASSPARALALAKKRRPAFKV